MTSLNLPRRDREEVLNDLLESVALEETALANMINVVSQKLQKFASGNTTPVEMVNMQKEAGKMMKILAKMQMLLQFKVDNIQELQETYPPVEE